MIQRLQDQNWRNSAIFSKLARFLLSCLHQPGSSGNNQEMENSMSNFDQISSKVFASASALIVSAVLMAVAIAPATQNIANTGMMA